MTAILRLAEDYFKADTVFLPMDVKQRTNRMGEEHQWKQRVFDCNRNSRTGR